MPRQIDTTNVKLNEQFKCHSLRDRISIPSEFQANKFSVVPGLKFRYYNVAYQEL